MLINNVGYLPSCIGLITVLTPFVHILKPTAWVFGQLREYWHQYVNVCPQEICKLRVVDSSIGLLVPLSFQGSTTYYWVSPRGFISINPSYFNWNCRNAGLVREYLFRPNVGENFLALQVKVVTEKALRQRASVLVSKNIRTWSAKLERFLTSDETVKWTTQAPGYIGDSIFPVSSGTKVNYREVNFVMHVGETVINGIRVDEESSDDDILPKGSKVEKDELADMLADMDCARSASDKKEESTEEIRESDSLTVACEKAGLIEKKRKWWKIGGKLPSFKVPQVKVKLPEVNIQARVAKVKDTFASSKANVKDKFGKSVHVVKESKVGVIAGFLNALTARMVLFLYNFVQYFLLWIITPRLSPERIIDLSEFKPWSGYWDIRYRINPYNKYFSWLPKTYTQFFLWNLMFIFYASVSRRFRAMFFYVSLVAVTTVINVFLYSFLMNIISSVMAISFGPLGAIHVVVTWALPIAVLIVMLKITFVLNFAIMSYCLFSDVKIAMKILTLYLKERREQHGGGDEEEVLEKGTIRAWVKQRSKNSTSKKVKSFCKQNLDKLSYLWFLIDLIYGTLKIVQMVTDTRRNSFLSDYLGTRREFHKENVKLDAEVAPPVNFIGRGDLHSQDVDFEQHTISSDQPEPSWMTWKPYVQWVDQKTKLYQLQEFYEDWDINDDGRVAWYDGNWDPHFDEVELWSGKFEDLKYVSHIEVVDLVNAVRNAEGWECIQWVFENDEDDNLDKHTIAWAVCSEQRGKVLYYTNDAILHWVEKNEVLVHGAHIAMSMKLMPEADLWFDKPCVVKPYTPAVRFNPGLPAQTHDAFNEFMTKTNSDFSDLLDLLTLNEQIAANIPLVFYDGKGWGLWSKKVKKGEKPSFYWGWEKWNRKPLTLYLPEINMSKPYTVMVAGDNASKHEAAILRRNLALGAGIYTAHNCDLIQLDVRYDGNEISIVEDLVETELKRHLLKAHFKSYWKRYAVGFIVTAFGGVIIAWLVKNKNLVQLHAGKRKHPSNPAKSNVKVDDLGEYKDIINNVMKIADNSRDDDFTGMYEYLQREEEMGNISKAGAWKMMKSANAYKRDRKIDHFDDYRRKENVEERKERINQTYGKKMKGGKIRRDHAAVIPEAQPAAPAIVIESQSGTPVPKEVATSTETPAVQITLSHAPLPSLIVGEESFKDIRGNVAIGYHNKDSFTQYGLGLIIHYKNTRYLLTAAHVYDKFKNSNKIDLIQYSPANTKDQLGFTTKKHVMNVLPKTVKKGINDVVLIPGIFTNFQQSNLTFMAADVKGTAKFFSQGAGVNTTYISNPAVKHECHLSAHGVHGDSGGPVISMIGDQKQGIIGVYTGKYTNQKPHTGFCAGLEPVLSTIGYSWVPKNH